jgi:hypothetical protein
MKDRFTKKKAIKAKIKACMEFGSTMIKASPRDRKVWEKLGYSLETFHYTEKHWYLVKKI